MTKPTKTTDLEVPAEFRPAAELLERYGRWAQDRYKKQRCGSAERRYQPPPSEVEEGEPLAPPIPDWNARQVQLALQVVPMQFRRVLFALYVPQKENQNAARRRMGLSNRDWRDGHIHGLRSFWSIYSSRYMRRLTRDDTIAANNRDTESCALVG